MVIAPADSKLRRITIDEREKPTSKRDPYYHSGPWSPYRPTVVYLGSVAIGLAIVEVPADAVLTIGLIGLGCTLLYLFPPTATLGAILLTGFLGGAVTIHLRVHGSLHDMGENVLIGVFAWSGLWLRDSQIRRILPIRL